MVTTAIKQKLDLDPPVLDGLHPAGETDKDKSHDGLQEMLPCTFFNTQE